MRESPILFLVSLAGVYIAGFAVLLVTLWRIQVHEAADWKLDQETQITRRVRTVGARGRILDSRGRILADCRASRNAVLLPERFASAGAKLEKRVSAAMEQIKTLEGLLNRESGVTVEKLEKHFRRSSVLPLVVFKDLNDVELAIVAEHGMEAPGFDIESESVRQYPFGSLACHILGYTGREIPVLQGEEALRRYHFVTPAMRGRAGLEAYYDQYLAGVPAERTVSVNALGYVTGADLSRPAGAHAGPDLRLTIDAAVQRTLEKELSGVTGAGVAISCEDGSVIAMASSPAFDLNEFDFEELVKAPGKPLFNRAIAGLYEPGSTFKPVTALAAGSAGIDANAPYVCTGIYKGTHCASRWGHGVLTLRPALAHSCNTFFLHLADATGPSNICAMAKSMGLGRRCGIDLAGEAAGSVEPWVRQAAIGQGRLQVTPLQMAVAAAAIANGGFIVRPHLKASSPGDAQVLPAESVEFDPATYALIRRGMEDVGEKYLMDRLDDDGVRHRLAVSAAAKTGTAERGPRENRTKNTWMIAYAPADDPKVAVALVVENGESGAGTAGPRVRSILKTIFGEMQP